MEGVVKMVSSDNKVLTKAKELADSLKNSKKDDSYEFLSLLVECNSIILKMTKIDYGTICSRQQGGCC